MLLREVRGDLFLGLDTIRPHLDGLMGVEHEISRDYEEDRLKEFCSGRLLVRQLLEALGHSRCAIGRTVSGAPEWPEWVTGSISHSGDLVGVLAGSSRQWCGIGLDIERIGRVDSALWPLLFTSGERRFLQEQKRADQELFATAFFSLKEAFLKLPSARPECFQDYTDIEIRYDARRYSVQCPGHDLRLHFGQAKLDADLFVHECFVVSMIVIDCF